MLKMNPTKCHPNRKAHNWLIYDIADRFLERHAALYKGVLYDFGCGEAPYREFFLKYCDKYIGIDWSRSLHQTAADIIADLNKPLPVKSESADTVVSLSVLEHLCEPQTALGEAFRILRPGGSIVLQAPWQWWIHDAPFDYCRYTPYGLRYFLEKAGFKDITVEAQSGFFTMMTMKRNYFTLRFVRGSKLRRLAVRWMLFPLWYLGQWTALFLDKLDKNWALESCGYFVAGRKPDMSTDENWGVLNVEGTYHDKNKAQNELLKMQLYSNIIKDVKTNFGVRDLAYLLRVTDNWFDDSRNYDGRWALFEERGSNVRILDMAAGCGTFVLHGLRKGKDVWGVEPEKWKLDYFGKKIYVSGYPDRFIGRVVPSVGEALPFKDGIFDLVTSWQTLEHVADVEKCLTEMLRIVKPGGSLFIRAPDYASFYEGHYRIFFFPLMPRPLARLYLRLRRRPVAGLETIQYVTAGRILRFFRNCGNAVSVENLKEKRWQEQIEQWIPIGEKHTTLTRPLIFVFRICHTIDALIRFREKPIELWVHKQSDPVP